MGSEGSSRQPDSGDTSEPGEPSPEPPGAVADRSSVVMVVDDHPVVRRGLGSLLAAETWVARVVEAATVRQARQVATTERPDVAVVDVALPDGDGVELVAQLRTLAPACSTIVLSMSSDPGTVQAALDAGARGYLLKDTTPDVLLAAVRTVVGGGQALGPDVTADVRGGPAGRGSAVDRLTPRERQVLGMLADGLSNSDISTRLFLSEKTVRNQVSVLLGKLGVDNRVQAALLAREHGLAGPSDG